MIYMSQLDTILFFEKSKGWNTEGEQKEGKTEQELPKNSSPGDMSL